MAGSSSRRKWAVSFVAFGLLLLLFLWFQKSPASSKPKGSGAADDPDNPTLAEVARRPDDDPAKAPAAAPPPPPSTPEPAPIVDDVTVEKKEVCEGEENLVTVRAHTENATDDYLHYHIGTDVGQSIPVRIWPNIDGSYPKVMISVFGRNNAITRVEMPPVKVKKCKSLRNAFIDARVNANTRSEFTFSATVVDLATPESTKPPAPFVPVSFAWTFGDGAEAVTTVPWTIHSYEERPQETIFAQFVVGVVITGEDGQKVTGRRGLELLNPVAEAFKVKGIVQLLFEMNPRFPEVDSSGMVKEHVRLFHLRPDSVSIEKMMLTKVYAGGVGEAPPEPISPSSVLGTTEIPPGRGIEFDLTLDTHDNDTFALTYQVQGQSGDGAHAQCMFSIMRPSPKPTQEAHDPLYDGELVSKIKLARELLHRDTVNDEDILRLEREGKFVNLKVDPIAIPTTFPTNLPKPPVPFEGDRVATPSTPATAPPAAPTAAAQTPSTNQGQPPKK